MEEIDKVREYAYEAMFSMTGGAFDTVRGSHFGMRDSLRLADYSPMGRTHWDLADGIILNSESASGYNYFFVSDFNITESTEENKIVIEATYTPNELFILNEDGTTGVYFDYAVEVTTDYITDIVEVTVSGPIVVEGI